MLPGSAAVQTVNEIVSGGSKINDMSQLLYEDEDSFEGKAGKWSLQGDGTWALVTGLSKLMQLIPTAEGAKAAAAAAPAAARAWLGEKWASKASE